ncbi:RecX family transcriptional regulator [uncultured Ilyobacter sp.]|uniref:RecX family transcriptional regulator n=1 Tax=uncultured Ilyobacter sp. TaxID=544433 RepID=UPI002AA86C02|nr:RecX family transcriptional regulator [uncultured Ilyobacter sp.]
MKILNLKRNKLYLEDDEIIDVSPDIIYEMGLSRKEELSIEEYKRVVYLAALSKSYYLLSRRDHTSKELERKLWMKFREKEIIKRVISEIEGKGYIDDYSYAKFFIEKSKEGRKKIEYDLRARGIKSEVIKEAFDEEGNKEVPKIKRLLHKISGKPYDKKINYLLRKGFDYENIKKALEEEDEE